jgi:hypothetical protein
VANRSRTKELYNQVLAAVRTYGPNFQKVGQVAGVHRETVRKLYEVGWPDREGCGPIRRRLEMDEVIVRAARAGADPEKQVEAAQQILTTSLHAAREDALDAADVLGRASKEAGKLEERAKDILKQAEERLEEVEKLARARISEAEKAAQATMGNAELQAKRHMAKLLQDAKVDTAETLADEANAAKMGRKAALGAVAIAALVCRDAQVIATQARAAIGDLSKMSPINAIRITREMVRLVEAAEKALILALQAERLRQNQPTEVLGITSMDSSLEEREIKMRAVQRAIAKQRGLSVVPAPVPPKQEKAG